MEEVSVPNDSFERETRARTSTTKELFPYLHLDRVLAPFLKNIDELARQYREAEPFPSIVIDDFLPPDVLDRVLSEFPEPESDYWANRHHFEGKLFTQLDEMPPYSRYLSMEFNSATFTGFLEKLTGISPLVADAQLAGGGLHMTMPGGALAVHADFNHHPMNWLDRRLNVLIYLNKDWKSEYGGDLELWDRTVTRRYHKIAPVFNRCVVFSTTSESFHGHADPLACPEGLSRKSLAFYYYTNGRPAHEKRENHATIWKRRPGDPDVPGYYQPDAQPVRPVPIVAVPEASPRSTSTADCVETTVKERSIKDLVQPLVPPVVFSRLFGGGSKGGSKSEG